MKFYIVFTSNSILSAKDISGIFENVVDAEKFIATMRKVNPEAEYCYRIFDTKKESVSNSVILDRTMVNVIVLNVMEIIAHHISSYPDLWDEIRGSVRHSLKVD
jgi:hypothetical protein